MKNKSNIKKYYVEIVGGINVNSHLNKLENLYKSLVNEVTITLPPWFQRKLQESEWYKDDNKKSKAYFSSAIKGTLRFEPFTFVTVKLLLSKLKYQLKVIDNLEEKVEAEKVIKHIESLPNAKRVIIDGQSRGYLSIVKFFRNEIPFTESLTFKKRDKDTNHIVDEFQLKGNYRKNMPEWVIEKINNQEYISNLIVDGELNEIIKALISKQEGVSWETFQKIYAEFALSNLFTRIRKMIRKPLKDFYKNKIKNKSKYKEEVNGLEFLLSSVVLYLRDKSWPTIEKIKRTCEYKDNTPSESIFKTLKSYLKEFYTYWMGKKSKTKIGMKVWITYALLRDILANGDSADAYYTDFGLTDSYTVLIDKEFCEWYIRNHSKYMSKENNNSYKHHWMKIDKPNGKYKNAEKPGGYPKSYKNDKDDSIKTRLWWLIQAFQIDKQSLIDKSTINIVGSKPTMEDIYDANDFLDADEVEIDFRDEYDAGHVEPESITGDNRIENFTPQKAQDNKEYSDTSLIR